jgi:hypothetical protein
MQLKSHLESASDAGSILLHFFPPPPALAHLPVVWPLLPSMTSAAASFVAPATGASAVQRPLQGAPAPRAGLPGAPPIQRTLLFQPAAGCQHCTAAAGMCCCRALLCGVPVVCMWGGYERSAWPNGWREFAGLCTRTCATFQLAKTLPSDLRCVQFVDDRHPPVYRPINWGHFRSKRYEGAWGWERVAVAASRSLLLLLFSAAVVHSLSLSPPGCSPLLLTSHWCAALQATLRIKGRRFRSATTGWTGLEARSSGSRSSRWRLSRKSGSALLRAGMSVCSRTITCCLFLGVK